jgi:hypothetical protein
MRAPRQVPASPWLHTHRDALARLEGGLQAAWERRPAADSLEEARPLARPTPRLQDAPWTRAGPGVRYGVAAFFELGRRFPRWSPHLAGRLEAEWVASEHRASFSPALPFIRWGWEHQAGAPPPRPVTRRRQPWEPRFPFGASKR